MGQKRILLEAIEGIPRIQKGDDLAGILLNALASTPLQHGDVLTITSKLFSRAHGRFRRISTVQPSQKAIELAKTVDKDPRLVQLILDESTAISRAIPGVLIVRHTLGFVCANAGLDRSNAMPADASEDSVGDWALLLPEDPDADAEHMRATIERERGVRVGIVITDSHGRPFRHGTVGIALGAAGIQSMDPHEHRVDLDGRPLEVTCTAIADQIAAASDLLAGQADEGTPVVLFRGLHCAGHASARSLIRDPDQDLYA